MSEGFYASVFARFDTQSERVSWMRKHVLDQSTPSGGPVSSYSIEDESGYRDECARLKEINAELLAALALAEPYISYLSEDHAVDQKVERVLQDNVPAVLNEIQAAIAKANGETS